MTNNNWIRSISKSYVQLNEAQDNRPVTDWNDGKGSLDGNIGKRMERAGILAFSSMAPESVERHGSPFNEDGSLNPSHIIVRDKIDYIKRKLGMRDASDESVLPHIKFTSREKGGGYNITLHSTPQTPKLQENRFFNQLDEARKMKPTSTDRVQNRKIKNAARSAHQIAATAISSIPSAVPHPEYSGGVYGYDDPVHSSIMDHLGDVAKTVTDPEQAIRLVAKKHGVDPKAAIAALSTSAPMSPRETVNRMAGIKVESVNNNMKKNNKSWIRQLSESYIRQALNENDMHQDIDDFHALHVPAHKGQVKAFLDDHVERTGNPLDPYNAAAIVASRFVDRNQDWQDAVGSNPTWGYSHEGGAGAYYDAMARQAKDDMYQREKNKK
jgi:hypothetical protein